jgi:hypothetical protein
VQRAVFRLAQKTPKEEFLRGERILEVKIEDFLLPKYAHLI